MTKFLIILVVLFSSTKLVAQEKFKVSYSGFFQDHLEPYPKLQFEIINVTNDTLYLSAQAIKFEVTKNSKRVIEEKIDFGIGTPFIRPKSTTCPERQLEKRNLASKFAQKLVKKNNIPKDEQQKAVQQVEIACIVVYPKEIVYEYKTFFHRDFDRNYNVTVEPYNNDFFISYESDLNERIMIKE